MAEQHDTRALFVISVAAELAGMHPQTLRIYERKGLVAPARTQGRSRRYSEQDIARLRRIQELTNDGLSLSGVERVLELEQLLERAHARIDELERELVGARRALHDAVEETHRQYRRQLVPRPNTDIVLLHRSPQAPAVFRRRRGEQ